MSRRDIGYLINIVVIYFAGVFMSTAALITFNHEYTTWILRIIGLTLLFIIEPIVRYKIMNKED